jgi:TolB protein
MMLPRDALILMKTALISSMVSLLSICSYAGPGIFEGQTDVGHPAKQGDGIFDSTSGVYHISGGGENMWFAKDDFHFAWKKVDGDFSISAELAFEGAGGNAHRKGCLMIRETLDTDSAYIDAALHGDGLTSLQFREAKGAPTREVQAASHSPIGLKLVKQGEQITLFLKAKGGVFECSGASYKFKSHGPLYVGLGVCAHDDKALETVRFSNVQLTEIDKNAKPALHSTIEIVPIGSKDRRVLYHTTAHLEAPNWSPNGQFLLFNQGGRIWRLSTNGIETNLVNTGFAMRCNNDHGISPDGQNLVISDQTKTGKSLIYILPITGGEPRQLTMTGPSYWHGWSPDGKTLAFCRERNKEFDIYTIPAGGGEERRLTTAPGLDDGPEYSPDGKLIYFNSERSGHMQIWKMRPDGSNQEMVTKDELNNWFAHPSPDGKWLVFLSFAPEVKGHPENKDVQLRLMNLQTGEVQPLAKLFGGQGTINVPSWSPDSKRVAFVSYHFE